MNQSQSFGLALWEGLPFALGSAGESHRGEAEVEILTVDCYIQQMTNQAVLEQLDYNSQSMSKDRVRSLHLKLRKPKNQLQDYEIKEHLGEGGYAKVKRALHKPTGEFVAVKILCLEHLTPGQVDSIDTEIKVQQKLLHEHIAQIYEVIRKDSKIYIFMEHCPNGELFDRIVNKGPIPEKEAARILHQIVTTLIYLRNMGISHRDIKPENVLFDKDWNVKLIDFGFSCENMASEDCFRKTVCGTPSYAAPEVLLKTAYIPELIDVWSVGVTLYAMLSGGLPFEGDNAAKQRNRIINYRWSQRSLFSQKLNKLFNCIFVEASKRITLDDLLNSDFLMSYYFDSACFIDSNRDQVLPEESILSMAQKECRMDRRKVIESVKQYRLDRFHAVYYILLKREMEGRKSMENSSLSIFKKQNRNSIKLESIQQTPPKRSKEISIAKLSQSVESKGRVRTMEIHYCRPRVEVSSEASRRLLEYKVMQTLYV